MADSFHKESAKETEEEQKPDSDREKVDSEQKNAALDDLLDSALADFAKPALVKPAKSDLDESSQLLNRDDIDVPTFDWSDEFVKQATAQFEDALKNVLSSEDDSLSEEFRKIAESTGRSMTSQEAENELSESLARTLRGLAENAEAVSNPLTDEEISQLLGNIGLSQDIGTDGGEPEDLLNVMKTVMQNLLSKEMLYPALKDIVDKYPNWLSDNKPKLSQTQYDQYTQQLDYMKAACVEFEAEKDGDSEDVKKARFERVLELMQKMQECGHPPKELVGDMVPGFEMDETGAPRIRGLPANAESCSLM